MMGEFVTKYEEIWIEYGTSFKYLTIEIGTMLSMGNNIASQLNKVRSSY